MPQKEEKPRSQTTSNNEDPELRSKAVYLKKLIAQDRARARLRPEDIGIVRVEFSVPASRLFGNNLSIIPGGGETASNYGLTDSDSDDPIVAINNDTNDSVVIIPVPGPAVD